MKAGKLVALAGARVMTRGNGLLFSMSALTALFVVRVLAQLVQWIYPLSWIPAFEDWQGSALPYPMLLAGQFCIVGMMAFLLHRVRNRSISPRNWKHRLCFAVGGVYFALMGFRLVAGLTVLGESIWFARPLPAFFHLVLAGFILLLGFHILRMRRNRRIFGP